VADNTAHPSQNYGINSLLIPSNSQQKKSHTSVVVEKVEVCLVVEGLQLIAYDFTLLLVILHFDCPPK
jgi:hypothetical protein